MDACLALVIALKIGDLYRIGENFSTKYFCNAKVAGLDEIVQVIICDICCMNLAVSTLLV